MDKNNSALQPVSPFISFRKNFYSLLSGAMAGALSRSAVAPVERLIILRQTNNQKYLNLSMFSSLFLMYKTEGFSSLFKGNGANCVRIAPFQAIEFFTFEYYKYIIDKFTHNFVYQLSDTSRYLICGALAGMTASTMVYPIDLCKTILAVQTQQNTKYKGIFRTIYTVFREKGFLSLYKGWGASMMGIAPYASLKLTFFQLLKNFFYGKDFDKKKMKSSMNLVFGALAGCLAVTVTYPTDFLRRRIQVRIFEESNTGINQKVKIVGMIKTIVKKEGIMIFYTGLGATYVKVMPSTALAFAINERLKKLFGVHSVN